MTLPCTQPWGTSDFLQCCLCTQSLHSAKAFNQICSQTSEPLLEPFSHHCHFIPSWRVLGLKTRRGLFLLENPKTPEPDFQPGSSDAFPLSSLLCTEPHTSTKQDGPCAGLSHPRRRKEMQREEWHLNQNDNSWHNNDKTEFLWEALDLLKGPFCLIPGKRRGCQSPRALQAAGNEPPQNTEQRSCASLKSRHPPCCLLGFCCWAFPKQSALWNTSCFKRSCTLSHPKAPLLVCMAHTASRNGFTLLCTSTRTATRSVHPSYFPKREKMTSDFQQEGLLPTAPRCTAQFLLLHKAPTGRLGEPRAGRHTALTSISAHAVQTALNKQDQRALS